MKRLLLTGSSGFVGSHVLRHILAKTDWEIVCPVTFKHKGLPDRIIDSVKGYDDEFVRTKIIKCDLACPISKLTSDEFGKVNYAYQHKILYYHTNLQPYHHLIL